MIYEAMDNIGVLIDTIDIWVYDLDHDCWGVMGV